jgi:hypothetical protein
MNKFQTSAGWRRHTGTAAIKWTIYNHVLYQRETKKNGKGGQIKSKPDAISRILVDETDLDLTLYS